MDWLKSGKRRVDTNNIFLHGASLGGAAAIQYAALASKNPALGPVRGIILENTFLSIADLLDSLMPWIAFNFVKTKCLRLRWESKNHFPHLTCPVCLLSGRKDEIVPS